MLERGLRMKFNIPILIILFILLPLMAFAQNTTENKANQNQPVTEVKSEQVDEVKATDTTSKPVSNAQPVDDANVMNEAYSIQIKNLEEKVNELKERVFRSKARLTLLQETVLMGKISGAKINLIFNNEMGSSFRLESISISLDGTQIFSKVNQDGSLESTDMFEILPPSSMVPGNHTVSIYLVYKGNGFGLFSYLNQYKFKVKSSYTFYVEEGKITKVKMVAYEKGSLTTDLKDRPAIRFDVEVKPVVEEKKAPPVSSK